MSKRAGVFVDGENFRYSIGNLFEQFDRKDYLPKKARWDQLFDWIVSQALDQAERIRTYWYVVQTLDFYPYRIPSLRNDPGKLRTVLEKDQAYKRQIATLGDDEPTAKLEELANELIAERNKIRNRFDGWRVLQDVISGRFSSIEFRRAGAITYKLFEKKFGSEKAVDVKLASDLIVLRDIYDVAVIVSGDQDYVPAVQVVKDSGKHVVNVAFRTRSGKLLPGGARRLNQLVDWSLEITYADLGQHLNIPMLKGEGKSASSKKS